MSIGKILVVDDDKSLLEVIKMRLETSNYEVFTALNEDEAIDQINNNHIDLSLIDLQLGHIDGIALMEKLHLINHDMPAIILTAYGSIESTVEAMKKGAYSYITKPFDPWELLSQIEKALERKKLASEVNRLKGLLEDKYDFTNIVGKSEKMQAVLNKVALVAKIDSTVFVYGESGTGKELIANVIHLASKRKDKPFVAINCSAIPETLIESELFGHEKGAFTGATQRTDGIFMKADKWTIFLDEIANTSLSTQNKLLRVLQEQQFYPIGSKNPVNVDVRVIVATNKELRKEVQAGRFRDDLFYRVHVIPIYLFPLREKKEDIPALVEHFVGKFRKQMNKKVKGLSLKAMQKLMVYDWPGNIRELENTIEYAMAMTQEDTIHEDLILPTQNVSPEPLMPFAEARAAFERRYLTYILGYAEGNVSKAAKIAGKYRADFYNLLKKHNLKPESFKKVKTDLHETKDI
jgi:two-component system response regulator GlrR